jgi:hypothetical protein
LGPSTSGASPCASQRAKLAIWRADGAYWQQRSSTDCLKLTAAAHKLLGRVTAWPQAVRNIAADDAGAVAIAATHRRQCDRSNPDPQPVRAAAHAANWRNKAIDPQAHQVTSLTLQYANPTTRPVSAIAGTQVHPPGHFAQPAPGWVHGLEAAAQTRGYYIHLRCRPAPNWGLMARSKSACKTQRSVAAALPSARLCLAVARQGLCLRNARANGKTILAQAKARESDHSRKPAASSGCGPRGLPWARAACRRTRELGQHGRHSSCAS